MDRHAHCVNKIPCIYLSCQVNECFTAHCYCYAIFCWPATLELSFSSTVVQQKMAQHSIYNIFNGLTTVSDNKHVAMLLGDMRVEFGQATVTSRLVCDTRVTFSCLCSKVTVYRTLECSTS